MKGWYCAILTVIPKELIDLDNIGLDKELFEHDQGVHVEPAAVFGSASHRPPNTKVGLLRVEWQAADSLTDGRTGHGIGILVQR